jgi:hypothetical protein
MGFLDNLKAKIEEKGLDIVQSHKNQQQKPMSKLGAVLFFFLFLLIGSIVIYFTYPWIANGLESSNWPNVEGVIISSNFILTRSPETPMYSAEILYEYYIENQKYLGNRKNGFLLKFQPESSFCKSFPVFHG